MSLDAIGVELTKNQLRLLIETGEVLARKYDIVVTNPPYMGSSGMGEKLSDYVKKNYKNTKSDMFAVFIDKTSSMLEDNRFLAMITQHSWMFLSDYTKFRESYLRQHLIINMAHLGSKAFNEIAGEVVQTTAFVVSKNKLNKYSARYLRLVEYDSEEAKKRAFLSNKKNTQNQFLTSIKKISSFPNKIIAYWISPKLAEYFNSKSTLDSFGSARQGLATSDNKRFLRLWFEIDFNKISFNTKSCEETITNGFTWYPYNKGGSFRKWSAIDEYVVNYRNDGKEIKETVLEKYPYLKTPDFVVKNTSTYFQHGITWNDVSTRDFCARWIPDGYIYDAAGPMFFSDNDFVFLGYFNSKVFQIFANVICQGLHYSTGHIPQIPYIENKESNQQIILLVKENIKISKSEWDSYELSWNFKKHPLIRQSTINQAFNAWNEESSMRFNQIKQNEESLNRIFIETFDLSNELHSKVQDEDITIRKADVSRDIRSFISYCIGCMVGRYSLDKNGIVYAGGEWNEKMYRSYNPDKDNIIPITDEEYFNDDIVGLFIDFIKKVYGEDTIEENLDFIANALGNKGNSSREIIRSYFINDFFKDHCSTYSVTGSGKRPIYWLFDSGKKNGFKALVYMHRYDANTIGNLRIDYLHRMQRIYENEIARMQDTIENSRDAREVTAATKRKEKLIKQLQETKEYDEKIAHLALARTSIDLDDGVKVNYEKIQTDRDGKKLDVLAKI